MKDHPAQPWRNQKAGGNRDAVEESMDDQAEQHRDAPVRVHVFIGVRLFAVVEVRGDGVLEEVDQQVAGQHQQRALVRAGKFKTLRHHLDQRRGQHEARAQGDEIAQIAPLPAFLHDDRAAETLAAAAVRPSRMLVRMRIDIGSEQNTSSDKGLWIVGRSRLTTTRPAARLSTVPDVHHVAVLHDVLLAFQTQCAAARASASEPASSNWSQWMVSARMK